MSLLGKNVPESVFFKCWMERRETYCSNYYCAVASKNRLRFIISKQNIFQPSQLTSTAFSGFKEKGEGGKGKKGKVINQPREYPELLQSLKSFTANFKSPQ